MLWSGFVLGILSSFHCIAMCGPLALAVPVKYRTEKGKVISRLLYNAGRIITYSLLGIISGIIGRSVQMAGFQQSLSIIGGIILLLLIGISYTSGLLYQLPYISKVRQLISKQFGKKTYTSILSIGVLNGLLPCGMVYISLASAITTGSILGSMFYMALFGLGTVPVMFSIGIASNLLGTKFNAYIHKLIPYLLTMMALLLIFRGLGLGVPYLSPEFNATTCVTNCCH